MGKALAKQTRGPKSEFPEPMGKLSTALDSCTLCFSAELGSGDQRLLGRSLTSLTVVNRKQTVEGD